MEQQVIVANWDVSGRAERIVQGMTRWGIADSKPGTHIHRQGHIVQFTIGGVTQ